MEIKKNQSLKATFKMKSKFDGNISSEHEGKTTFGCEICGKCFPNETQLAKHIDAIHKGKKPFKCDSCEYSCSQKGNMKRHVTMVHEGKKHLYVTFVTTAVLKRGI